MSEEKQMRYLTIVVPSMETIPTAFAESLIGLLNNLPENTLYTLFFEKGSLVYDARNNLVNRVLEDINNPKSPATEENSYVLWLDSDEVFNPTTIAKLFEDMDKTEDAEVMSALYYGRRAPFTPIAYDKIQMLVSKNGARQPSTVDISDEKINSRSVVEVKGIGLGCVLMKNTIWKKLFTAMENSALPFSPILCYGEDLSFCIRCQKAGVKIYVDTECEVGHLLAYNIASASGTIGLLRALFAPPQQSIEDDIDIAHKDAEEKLEGLVERVKDEK